MERINQCLETYLRCFCSYKPDVWTWWLPWAAYWHNITLNSPIGLTPYEVVYGRRHLALIQYIPKTVKVQAIEDALMDRDQISKLLKDNLAIASERMKSYADKKRSERTFEVGDWVLLKLQPYRQLSVRGSVLQKLSPKLFGPYSIVVCVGKVAYQLKLPPESRIHNFFHISQLKHYKGEVSKVNPTLPLYWEPLIKKPKKILEWRMLKKQNKVVM